MAKEFSRTRRIAQQLQQELAMVLQRDMKDPRIGFVTVNDVDVSRDLSYAKVYVTFFEEDTELVQQKIDALTVAAPYVRTLVAGRMKLRVMPELRFIYDSSLVEGMRMSNLVTQVINKDKAKQQQFTPDTPDNSESVDGEKEQD
ncbi:MULTISPECIES: 30S ribosome-binding factor RbfA [Shewanella]|jgi:ribosome-binding factor A|uniref:Ribosome-binding factor A n=2 Tax=Shewanella frigidimarina TaxID=56812 RepID=RBFA_SHEFN|nr:MULTISPECIES: 30S ribosome-binding factor RbfA [Shewanella]Q086H1.1 RecName: Full=Ribosome-binding factor A [Shewanella frigidimarina NCIMB 400]ABI70844.1 ribosome-binding factor A [Shewanella frigidimarina NCIMB 400]KVX01071.1 ribosome-binding factor A [Shewanella frigidimarina]MBB1425519.1 30S ribosome-binding factor RbfA [Shewanella sp. SG44-2]PKH98359.1 30S ribosome-binding factor RbfA [Shewanella sp. 11B5]RPA31063.1 30S ribosome-binding factor RbfA [Shewanella frigidimarina]|tara:strand:+ start:877 stop:1308 length:432 start_codon:yes stop_codon:yes gene_type:complete